MSIFLSVSEEECYNSLTSLVASKHKVFVTQTKLLYEVTWKTVMHITRKHVVSIHQGHPSSTQSDLEPDLLQFGPKFVHIILKNRFEGFSLRLSVRKILSEDGVNFSDI